LGENKWGQPRKFLEQKEQNMDEIKVGDKVTITYTSRKFGDEVGDIATVEAIEDDGAIILNDKFNTPTYGKGKMWSPLSWLEKEK